MTLLSCVYFWSFLNGIDPQITKAIIKVESEGKAFAVSKDRHDYGLMQIRKKFVPQTKLQLLNSCTNIMVGTKLLAQAKNKCKHSVDNMFVVCYNLGIRGGSRLRSPKKWGYYKKVLAQMEN